MRLLNPGLQDDAAPTGTLTPLHRRTCVDIVAVISYCTGLHRGSTRYHGGMRFPLLTLTLAAAGLAAAPKSAEVARVHRIYILPMTQALDQYIASRLTRSTHFQVVTDPQAAEAVFTDRIGEALDAKLAELYPKPEVSQEKDEAAEKERPAEVQREEERLVRFSSFGRGRGNVFLVDPKAQKVLWSNYVRPRNSSPDELDRVAETIVKRLERDAAAK